VASNTGSGPLPLIGVHSTHTNLPLCVSRRNCAICEGCEGPGGCSCGSRESGEGCKAGSWPPRRRLARPYNPAPPFVPFFPHNPTYTHLSFLYKRRVPCFDPSRSNVTFLTSKSRPVTGPHRVPRLQVLCLAHTLPGRLPCCHCVNAFLVRKWSFSSPRPALRAR
jgi:hypothetical protein